MCPAAPPAASSEQASKPASQQSKQQASSQQRPPQASGSYVRPSRPLCGVVQRQSRTDICPSSSRTSNASTAHGTAHKHLKCEGPKVCVGAPYANVVVIGSAASSASSQLLALCCPALVTFVGVGTTAVSPGQLPSGK